MCTCTIVQHRPLRFLFVLVIQRRKTRIQSTTLDKYGFLLFARCALHNLEQRDHHSKTTLKRKKKAAKQLFLRHLDHLLMEFFNTFKCTFVCSKCFSCSIFPKSLHVWIEKNLIYLTAKGRQANCFQAFVHGSQYSTERKTTLSSSPKIMEN